MTGAARGIGLAVSELFLANGYRVALLGVDGRFDAARWDRQVCAADDEAVFDSLNLADLTKITL